MSSVNDQFVSYKIGIDSLVTNQQENIAMSTTFPLGTSGQTAQGSTSIIPILQPVGSSGTLIINQRTTTPEIFTISSNSYISSTKGMTSGGPVPIPTTQTFATSPSSLLINLSTKNAFWNNTAPGSVLINSNTWSATVNVTPDISDCLASGMGNNVTYLPVVMDPILQSAS